MPPKERMAYGLILTVFVFGAGFVGAQRLRQPPKVEIQMPKDGKNPFQLSTPPAEFAAPSAPQEVVVDIVGAVASPGLRHLPAGARVDDAVKAAGGLTGDADTVAINLAAKLEDGQQIVVPVKGAQPEAATALPSPGSSKGKIGGKHPVQPINLGSASFVQLEELPGVGPAMADKMMRYRLAHGHLTFQDLRAIPGLGPKKLENIKPWVR